MFVCNVSLTICTKCILLKMSDKQNLLKERLVIGLFLYKFLEKFSKIWAKDANIFLEIKFIRNFPFRTLHKVLQT